jgi:mono/diheme cytochrome c family protein
MRFPTLLPLLAAALALATGPIVRAADTPNDAHEARQFFENKIRPIFAQHCYDCHGEKKQKAGLRLDTHAAFTPGGESGVAVVAGKPDDSLLIQAVRRTHADLEMPPDDPLPAADVALLERWVATGAYFPPDTPGTSVAVARDEWGFTAEQRAYWAFQPVAAPTPPALPGNRWVRHDLDRFIAAKHAELKLTPAPEADRHEFVRRIYFDVHGLPPTRAQIEAFVNDRRPDAFERLVDELLASPRYGERWAQHWLDLVRYAESDGYRADAYRPGAWPYRDYVIRSLNADKPYDQFVREQLAGDELAPGDPNVLIATSYLRNPVYEWNQRDVRGQADLIVDDMTANAGEVFLGLSLGCARCHDHKFDPILQKDYFAFRAFFENVLWRTDLRLATADEQAKHDAQLAQWEAATTEIRRQMDELTRPTLDKNVQRAHARFTDDIKAMMAKPPAERDPVEQILAVMSERQMQYERDTFDPLKAIKEPAGKVRYKELEAELRKFDHLKPAPLLPAFVATDTGPKAPPTRMKSRKGEREVAPGFLTLLDPKEPTISPLPQSSGRRSALAAWITRPDHPLTSRVIVNRVWQHHFGRGLAATPNDFGRLGEVPTHPELLDWLARRFVTGGWSLKSLHRDILLSATYRQTARIQPSETAARVDPANKFLWRFSPRRLDAEQIRDAALAASGELDLTAVGGPSQEANTSPRRAIYTIKKRNNQNELLRAMDAPAGFTSIPERIGTSTPIQALLFMNGDWMLTRARMVAARSPSVEAAWENTLGRPPTAAEKQLADGFLATRVDAPGGPSGPLVLPADVATATGPGRFHENTAHERVLIKQAPREGDDFTVEAIVTPASVDAAASVRTIVSRWTGEKSSVDAHGWSLGLTGRKSAYKPLNLILQLVGEDNTGNSAYEVVASGLFLTLDQPHHVSARVSSSDGTVTFTVHNLSQPDAGRRTATVKHGIVGKLGTGLATPVIGGLYRRSPHQFDGRIEAARILAGTTPDDTLSADPARWPATSGVVWTANAPASAAFEWTGSATVAESADPRARALADLCHVLLNSNEFLTLH